MNLLEHLRMIAQEQGNPLEWQRDAVCNQTDPEAFFPENIEDRRMAIAICNTCPVKKKCLDYALANEEEFGVWGGVDFTNLKDRTRRMMKKGENIDSRFTSERARPISVWAREFQRLSEESRSI